MHTNVVVNYGIGRNRAGRDIAAVGGNLETLKRHSLKESQSFLECAITCRRL